MKFFNISIILSLIKKKPYIYIDNYEDLYISWDIDEASTEIVSSSRNKRGFT